MSFDNTKYDVEINSVPYRIRGYQKSELAPFIPRLGSGDQAESLFDLLRAKTVKGFDGGNLQREWVDEQSLFATEGLYPVYDDGVLYPVNPLAQEALLGKAIVTAWCRTKDYFFYAIQSYNMPTNTIYRVDTSGNRISLTLPASISTPSASNEYVSSMCLYDGRLMVAMNDGSVLGQMIIQSSTTVTDITLGTGSPYLLCVFNGQLYATNSTGDAHNSIIYRYTGTMTTKAFTEVGRVPTYITDHGARFFVYNNRLMLSRIDGLYAYDGVRIAAIEDLAGHEHERNYRYATVLKGYLYYFMPDGFYRFNGSLIEKLYDVSEVGFPVDMCEGNNRLWILYSNSGYDTNVSRYDKSMGYDYSNSDNIAGRISVFNGKSIYTYGRTTIFIKNPATIDFSGQSVVHRLMFFNNKVYASRYYDKDSNGMDTVNVNEIANSGNKAWGMVSSIFDGDFAMVDKNLDSLELTFDGTVSADQDVTLEYRTAGFDGATGWTSLGTIKTQTRVKEYVFRTIAAGVTFRKIQFRLAGTTAVTYGLAKLIVRYNLTPDVKFQWSFTALCYGDVPLEPLLLADSTDSSQIVSLLRGNIYNARMSDVPIKLVDVDQLDLSGAHTDAVTTITLNSTNLLKESGFVQIDNEVIYYAAKSATQLTGCIRAMLGTVAAAHSDNAKVFPVYRTIIRQIQNERIEMSDRDPDSTEDKSRQSEITLVLQEV